MYPRELIMKFKVVELVVVNYPLLPSSDIPVFREPPLFNPDSMLTSCRDIFKLVLTSQGLDQVTALSHAFILLHYQV